MTASPIRRSRGARLFGSYHLDEDGTSLPSYLFRIDTDGAVHIADEGIYFSNGLAFSPDCSTLYLPMA